MIGGGNEGSFEIPASIFCNSYISVHFVLSFDLLSLECHCFNQLVAIPIVGLINCSMAFTFLALARPSRPHPIFGYGIKLMAIYPSLLAFTQFQISI